MYNKNTLSQQRITMKKLFIPLLLFSALEANEKNGFFIEAGFETGLLEGTQTQEKDTPPQK
ncbi:putative homB, partial [Helicobacter pylori R055a]